MDWAFNRFDIRKMSVAGRRGATAFAVALSVAAASGQLVTTVNAIPRTGKPPVVFLNGYQGDCEGSSFRGTFDVGDQILQRDGRASLFFDNCKFANHPAIETLGNEFGKFLRSLRYDNGEPVSQVDVVAHSMGGLIVRSYLSGKQVEEGVFTPPLDTMIRKGIFLGTPHFGSPATGLLAGGRGDTQTAELLPGGRFVFDLATWNQGIDDLRGVDAIAVLGNAANGLLLMRAAFGDGVTTLTSGSLGFLATGRTRVIPYCHTGAASLVCAPRAGQLAQLNSAEHPSARIVLSFLNDTPEWQSIGTSAEQDPILSKGGGILLRYRDANDRPQQLVKATSPQGDPSLVTSMIAFSDYLSSAQPLDVALTLPNNEIAALRVPVAAGSTRAVTLKPGPEIAAIFPSFAAIFPRSVAQGSLITLYGKQLTDATGSTEVTVAGQRTPVSFAGPDQINTMVPEKASGLVKVQVKNAAGEHTLNLLIDPVVPALFAAAVNAVTGVFVTPQAPLLGGDFVTLFVTGLGATDRRDGLDWAVTQPEVMLGGQPCAVTFAGRAPGFPGLDQVNCKISTDVQPSDAAPVFVRSRLRVSNVTTLSVR